MKNGWKKLFIISLVIILLEVIGTIIMTFPFYTRHKVFVNIEKGDAVKTKGYYDMLSDSGKDKIQTYLDDFAATICEKYIDGDRSYDETVASLDAIKEVDSTGQLAEGYIRDVASNEFKSIMLQIYEADLSRNSNSAFELKSRLEQTKQRLDNETRERLMVQLLNEKYQSFLNEDLSGEAMLEMCSLVTDNSYYQAYDYAAVLASNAENIVIYRNLYTELQNDYLNSDYFKVMEKSGNVSIDKKDEKYKMLFGDLYTASYESGKIYYTQQLAALASSGDKKAAVELKKKIEACYGSDVDTSFVSATLFADWQRVYLDFIENFDASASSHKIDTILLFDMNDDDVPELFMFDSAEVENTYVGCEIYNVVNGKCKSLGYWKVINICEDGYIITLPSSGGGDEAYALSTYDGEEITEGDECKKVGDSYYVNGQEVSDADYLSVRTGILGHASAYTIKNSKKSDLEGASEYIMLFENK